MYYTEIRIRGGYLREPQSALLQPADRDYKKHGGKRRVRVEVKNDGIAHNLRTHGETLVAIPIKTANKLGYDIARGGTE